MSKKAAPDAPFQNHAAGKSVCFAGRSNFRWDHDQFVKFLRDDGIKVVDEIDEKTDYLVLGVTGFNTLKKKAEQLNQKKGASIQILEEDEFYTLLAPTLDEVLELLRSGPTGVARATQFLCDNRLRGHAPNLTGQDLSKMDLRGWKMHHYTSMLSGVNLCGADLRETSLAYENCQLDGARFEQATIEHMDNCSAVETDFTGVASIFCHGMNLSNNNFTRSNFRGVRLSHAQLNGCIFDEANLTGADLSRSIFPSLTGVSVRGADFSRANLAETKLRGLDLSGCKFVKANLSFADLTDAKVDGADFTGATLAGAVLTNVDAKKAIGLNPDDAKSGASVGAAAKEWIKAGAKANKVASSVVLEKDGKTITVHFTRYRYNLSAQDDQGGNWYYTTSGPVSQTPENLLLMIASRWAGATPIPASITVSASKASKSGKELKELTIRMWCELFGVPMPSAEELKKQAAAVKSSKQAQIDDWVKTLQSDANGVEKWNKEVTKTGHQLVERNFAGVDLNKGKLAGWQCMWMDCPDCNFEDADLQKANFSGTKLTNAKLARANCRDAIFANATLKDASCVDADFTAAVLRDADLRGADLAGALLKDAYLERAKFDEHTKFPKGFRPTLDMKWHGPGASPAHAAEVAKHKAKKPLDIEAFMKRLEAGVDVAKLSKALSMLKADRFKLYAQVTDGHLVGIVKSQGDPDLVYSCKLASDGVYGCCTQNLNICGGLRGSLCKHLLVLIVGLTKAGDLDPNTIDTWVLASRGQKPALDKDAASETFLKYKGAEAGEVDWRPTETIPEDYYAM